MKKIIMFGLFVVVATVYAADPNQAILMQAQIADMQKSIDAQLEKYENLDNRIIGLNDSIQQMKAEFDKIIDYQIQCNEKAITSVNTSISGASYALSIIGIGLAGIGILVGTLTIGIGIYISRQVKNVTHIAKEGERLFEKFQKLGVEIRDIDENIKNNMSKLYNNLKKEETKTLIERLVEVPEDMANLFHDLASRDVSEEFFPQIKKAYLSLPIPSWPGMPDYKSSYRMIFFQHFATQSIFDSDLGNEMKGDFHRLIEGCFKNDIMKASKDFIAATIREGDLFKFSEITKKFFVALKDSKFRDDQELYKYIYDVLRTKENRFNLYSILQQEGSLKGIAKMYGQFLLNDYKDNSGNIEIEKNILADITKSIEGEKGDTDTKTSEQQDSGEKPLGNN